MDIKKAENLANKLIAANHLIGKRKINIKDLGYKFALRNAKTRCGACSYRNKEIILDIPFVQTENEEEIRDTLLHEIAHAISYYLYGIHGSGHGRFWKYVCREIGARPEREKSGTKLVEGKYTLANKDSGKIYMYYYRRPAKVIRAIQDGRLFLRDQPQTKGKLVLLEGEKIVAKTS